MHILTYPHLNPICNSATTDMSSRQWQTLSEISPSVSKYEGACQSPPSVSSIVIAARLSACGEHLLLTRGEPRLPSTSVLDHYSQSKQGEELLHNVTEPVSVSVFVCRCLNQCNPCQKCAFRPGHKEVQK